MYVWYRCVCLYRCDAVRFAQLAFTIAFDQISSVRLALCFVVVAFFLLLYFIVCISLYYSILFWQVIINTSFGCVSTHRSIVICCCWCCCYYCACVSVSVSVLCVVIVFTKKTKYGAFRTGQMLTDKQNNLPQTLVTLKRKHNNNHCNTAHSYWSIVRAIPPNINWIPNSQSQNCHWSSNRTRKK